MSDAQFERYKNLHIFATEWRKYKAVSKVKDAGGFRKEMQFLEYAQLIYANETGKPVHIFLLAPLGKYHNNSQNLKKLLVQLKRPTDVILVSHTKFKVYEFRAIRMFNHLRVKTYLHENFNLIVPNGALCYPHRIMKPDEVNRLLNEELFCQLINLPKIFVEDVQCIWRGAELGDVMEIKLPSDITGELIQYRVVVAKTGRIISFRDYDKKEVEVDETEDDEILEHREAAGDNESESE